jgi:hypothetical protein
MATTKKTVKKGKGVKRKAKKMIKRKATKK